MTITLSQTPVKTEPDIIRVHELALETARWAGLSSIEQVRFAAAVAENCPVNGTVNNPVLFSITEEKDGKIFLRAEINISGIIAEKQLAPGTSINDLPLFQETRKEQWEKAYRDMQQFTFALAHDLKNTLTKLKIALSLVEEEQLPPHIETYMKIVYRAASRFEETMLSLNKVIRLGDLCPDVVQKIIPQQVFANVQEEFAESLVKINATVTTDFTQVTELNYIEIYLKSIFSNLLSNAIKYSSPHQPLEISVIAEKKDDKTVFVFSDNGLGIDLHAHGNKLFTPFTRFSANTEGSGIGLYLIKNIVARNGGHIEVESKPGTGTVFRLFLQEYTLPADE